MVDFFHISHKKNGKHKKITPKYTIYWLVAKKLRASGFFCGLTRVLFPTMHMVVAISPC